MMINRSLLASALLLGLLFAAFTSSTTAVQSTAKRTPLKAFGTVQICTPLSVLIVPSSLDSGNREESSYSLTVEGEAAVHQSIRGRVSKGILYLEALESFETHADAKITVSLPYNVLKAVTIKTATNVFVSKGFKVSALELTATMMGGAITAEGLTVDQLTVRANGVAAITATGSFDAADIFADGTARVQISGVKTKANVLGTGVASVAVVTTSSDALIKGMTQGSSVTYNQGSCTVKAGFNGIGDATCRRDSSLKITAVPMKWTCQASSNGVYECGKSGSSTTSFSSVGSDCQTMEAPKTRKASEGGVNTSRRLRETTISTSTSTSGSSNAGASTFTYTSNTPSEGGKTSQTVCNFVNNVGSCTVNGTPVPVRQYGLGGAPAPSPSTAEEALNAAISSASTSNAQAQVTANTSPGGTVCTFVNGIGGCSTG